MPYKDIFKRRACEKRYYQRNKLYYKRKNDRRKKFLYDFVISLKKHPCSDCGKEYPHYIMDFDHKGQIPKLTNISAMISYHHYSKEKILEEVKKCDLVCANCHRERTHKRLTKSY